MHLYGDVAPAKTVRQNAYITAVAVEVQQVRQHMDDAHGSRRRRCARLSRGGPVYAHADDLGCISCFVIRMDIVGIVSLRRGTLRIRELIEGGMNGWKRSVVRNGVDRRPWSHLRLVL